MTTVQQVIMNLLSGIEDAAVRIDIARTLMYLFNVYASGRVSEEEVRQSVEEIVRDIVKYKHPELSPDELKRIVKQHADQIMQAFRLSTTFRRTAVRFGW